MQIDGSGGSSNIGFLETAASLKERYGYKVFFVGVTPKLIRAAISHSITFYVYDLITQHLLL